MSNLSKCSTASAHLDLNPLTFQVDSHTTGEPFALDLVPGLAFGREPGALDATATDKAIRGRPHFCLGTGVGVDKVRGQDLREGKLTKQPTRYANAPSTL